MQVITAPERKPITKQSIFLAGTIDDGKSEDWQSKLIKEFSEYNITILNPRRNNWGDLTDNELRKQITWELDHLEKADIIFQNLVFSDPIHASALEHCATPIVSNEFFNVKFNPETWEKGITHVRRDGTLCSGNFAGYIQYRQLFDNHTCYEYQPA